MSALGSYATCGTLSCDTLKNKNITRAIPDTIVSAGVLPALGFHILDPSVNPSNFTVPDGSTKGDVVEFLHRTGGLTAVITPSDIHGGITTITMVGGGYIKLIWTGTQWYIIGRCGDGAALGDAVLNYPVLA